MEGLAFCLSDNLFRGRGVGVEEVIKELLQSLNFRSSRIKRGRFWRCISRRCLEEVKLTEPPREVATPEMTPWIIGIHNDSNEVAEIAEAGAAAWLPKKGKD